MNANIWAIILAAGESKRMGFPKMLLPFQGKSMLENVIINVTGSDVYNTIVVLGSGKEALEELTRKYKVINCYNDNYKEGMLSSVQCGFHHVPADCTAVLVFQGDQPLIGTSTINKVINAFRSSDKGIIIPVYKKKRGHPILIDKRYRNEIDKLDARKGLRSLTYVYPEDILEVETDEPGILRDFDTYKDYKEEINKIM
jgi:molybdenum cofactor cytidylyltransferase